MIGRRKFIALVGLTIALIFALAAGAALPFRRAPRLTDRVQE